MYPQRVTGVCCAAPCVRQVGPVLEAMEEVVLALTRALDGRVYVALGRGLWDFTAKEVFDYVESLQEGQEHQVRMARALP